MIPNSSSGRKLQVNESRSNLTSFFKSQTHQIAELLTSAVELTLVTNNLLPELPNALHARSRILLSQNRLYCKSTLQPKRYAAEAFLCFSCQSTLLLPKCSLLPKPKLLPMPKLPEATRSFSRSWTLPSLQPESRSDSEFLGRYILPPLKGFRPRNHTSRIDGDNVPSSCP
jgi:hypothetical protein